MPSDAKPGITLSMSTICNMQHTYSKGTLSRERALNPYIPHTQKYTSRPYAGSCRCDIVNASTWSCDVHMYIPNIHQTSTPRLVEMHCIQYIYIVHRFLFNSTGNCIPESNSRRVTFSIMQCLHTIFEKFGSSSIR